MPYSFTATDTGALAKTHPRARRVLVTGAGGRIGSYFAQHLHEKYDLRLMVQFEEQSAAVREFGEVVVGELSDLPRLKGFCGGVDTVVHLAANPDPSATWGELLEANIVGCYNAMVAAKAAGCRRLIFASSIHAVGGYPPDVQVKTSEPVNPGTLYGVTKCFGEALGRYMAEQEGLSVIAIRIGWYQPVEAAREEDGVRLLDVLVSRDDLNQLIEKCINVENIQFAIFHGLSDNRFKHLDISDARELVGYDPRDDAARENPRLAALLADARTTREREAAMDPEQSGVREELRG